MRYLLALIPLIFLLAFVIQHDFLSTPGIKSAENAVSSFQKQASGISGDDHLPGVLIYRRTKKTGSSSMLEALISATKPYGYYPLIYRSEVVIPLLRIEAHKPNPRRFLIAQHNRITREHTQGRRAIILDTFVDGFRQVTSNCRFSGKASDCGESMVKCMKNPDFVRSVNTNRWAGRNSEDSATFIDMPLSSAHPALSTSVFRHIFENATLNVGKFNVVGSACEDNKVLRKIYKENFKNLDLQVSSLRTRMLALTGYPVNAENVTSEEMLDAAEELERKKYQFRESETSRGRGPQHAEYTGPSKRKWIKKDGKVVAI